MTRAAVIEQEIEIRTADGVSGGFLYKPGDGKDYPGVVHLTDISGIRDSHHGMARRLAEQGYAVLLPNVFYRTAKPPVLEFPFKAGEERSMQRFRELTAPLTPAAMESDGSAYVDFLGAQTRLHPMGVVGYCFTGAMAMRTAAARSDRILAAASFHGGGLYSDQESSPHRALPRTKARLYFGHASNDGSMPAEAIQALNHALEAWSGKYESEVYSGGHGWTVPDSPVYNPAEAERAFRKLTRLFAETLK
jgi:carboxymethylenebutenolidase